MARKVAIYARVSTEHEAQLSALENQVQYYDNILAAHPDWELYGRYIDEGITGTSIKKRKNFKRMIEDAQNGCFDLIVTREVSRFARNTVDTLQETRKLKKMGVEVYFTEDNIWTFNDEDGELKLTIMATLAQNESKKTSQRVKAGQKISFENGVFYGNGNILGYDKVDSEMVINEEQAEMVRFIFSSFLSGMGSTKIKYEIEKKGWLTATGLKTWSASYINRVLQNPFYCGTIVYRKSYIPDYFEQKAKKNNGEVEQVIVEGRHQPIISKDDFDKVQKIIKERSDKIKINQKAGQGIPKSVWSKKLVCSCGSTFNKKNYHKKADGNTTYCYQCYKQKNMGSARTRLKKGLDIEGACDIPMIPEWKLNAMACVVIENLCEDKERIIEITNTLIDETIKEDNYKDEIEVEIKTLSKKLDSNNKKMEKLLDMYLNEMITKEGYLKKKVEIEENIKECTTTIEELEKMRGIPKDTLNSKIKNLKQAIKESLNFNNTIAIEEIIDSFTDKIVVKNDGFDWNFNYFNDIINIGFEGSNKSSQFSLCVNGELPPELNCSTSCCKK